jgi:hypothetical protein
MSVDANSSKGPGGGFSDIGIGIGHRLLDQVCSFSEVTKSDDSRHTSRGLRGANHHDNSVDCPWARVHPNKAGGSSSLHARILIHQQRPK